MDVDNYEKDFPNLDDVEDEPQRPNDNQRQQEPDMEDETIPQRPQVEVDTSMKFTKGNELETTSPVVQSPNRMDCDANIDIENLDSPEGTSSPHVLVPQNVAMNDQGSNIPVAPPSQAATIGAPNSGNTHVQSSGIENFKG